MDLIVYSQKDMLLTLFALVLGVGIGLWYRLVRVVFAPFGKLTEFLGDLLFWLVAGLAHAVFFGGFTYGQVRGFLLAADVLGVFLYFWWFDHIILWLLRFLITPIKNLCAICAKIAQKIGRFFKKLLKMQGHARII